MPYVGIDAKNDIRLNATSDLDLTSDSTTIKFGADDDVILTHVHNTGLTLNSTNKMMFNDASQFIQGSSATVLSLGATDEIDLTATTIDINGAVDVSGNATIGGNIVKTAGSGTFTIETSGSSSVNLNASSSMKFTVGGSDSHQFVNGSDTVLTIDSSGNVDLAGYINFSGTASSFASISQPRIFRSGSSSGSYPFDAFGHLVLQSRGDGSNRDIVFATGTSGANKSVIDASGNVGIGTDSPSQNLHISSSDHTRALITGGTNKYAELQFENDAQKFAMGVQDDDKFFLYNSTGTSTVLTVDTSNRVGIGASAPGYDLEVRSNDTSTEPQVVVRNLGTGDAAIGFQIASANNYYIGVDNSDSDKLMLGRGLAVGTNPALVIDTSSNIGIGTTAPSSDGGVTLEIRNDSTPTLKLNDGGDYQGYLQLRGNDLEVRGSNGAMEFYTGAADGASSTLALTIDSNQFVKTASRVGIGENNPDRLLHLTDSACPRMRFTGNGSDGAGNVYAEIEFENADSSGASLTVDAAIKCRSSESNGNGGELSFFTGLEGTTAERIRIRANGNVKIGENISTAIGDQPLLVERQESSHDTVIKTKHPSTNSRFHIDFHNSSGTQGNITVNSGSVSYNSTSDYRKKENVNYDWDGTTELKKLKPAKFNFIDEKDTIEGFLAHEVSEVVPLAVTGEKDQVNKDGEPEYQSMDASKLVPLLVKTIQELEARIAKLEGE